MNSTYKKYVQKDGLQIVLVPDDSKDVVTTMVMVGTGSRYESDDIAGISHVIEHMFYKGSKKRPTPLKVAEFIEDIGGEHNAFTGKEYTGYYTKTAAKHLAKSIDFLSDVRVSPLFLDEALEKEKLVILQEYDMYEDLPMEVSSSKFEEALFGKNSLGRDVIGYRETIKEINRNTLLEYKDRYYQSQNIVLVIVGNTSAISEKELLDLIESKFVFNSGSKHSYSPIVFPKKKSSILIKKKTEQTHLTVGFRGAARNDDDKYVLKLLGVMLGGSMSSRMFTEIRERLGLAYAVRTTSDSYLDTGTIDTYAGVPSDKWQKAISAILVEYRKILSGFSDAEFVRAKEIISGRMLIGLEDTNELANLYGANELLSSQIITPSQIIGKYQEIVPADLSTTVKKYFKEDNMAIGLVGSNITEDELKEVFNF